MKKRHNNNIRKCLIRLESNPQSIPLVGGHLHMLAVSSRDMSVQKITVKATGNERSPLPFFFLGTWRGWGELKGKGDEATEKSARSLMLEHHGPRVRQRANFWGYDAYIDDEQRRNGANANALTLYMYQRQSWPDFNCIRAGHHLPCALFSFYDFSVFFFFGGKEIEWMAWYSFSLHTLKLVILVVWIPDGLYSHKRISNSNIIAIKWYVAIFWCNRGE